MTFKDWLQTRRGNNFGHFAIGLVICVAVALTCFPVAFWLLPFVTAVVASLCVGQVAQAFLWLGREGAHVEIKYKLDSYGRWWVPYLRVLFRRKDNPDETDDFYAPFVGVPLFFLIGAAVTVILWFV